jgi:formylglycine-generating enzyme required for sulfatase activity
MQIFSVEYRSRRKVKSITADVESGPGYALLILDCAPAAGPIEISIRNLYRGEYLGESLGSRATWLRQPHYFTAQRVDARGTFRLGPEVCNHIPPDTVVEIASRNGGFAPEQMSWEGTTVLKEPNEENVILPDAFSVPGLASARPTAKLHICSEPVLPLVEATTIERELFAEVQIQNRQDDIAPEVLAEVLVQNQQDIEGEVLAELRARNRPTAEREEVAERKEQDQTTDAPPSTAGTRLHPAKIAGRVLLVGLVAVLAAAALRLWVPDHLSLGSNVPSTPSSSLATPGVQRSPEQRTAVVLSPERERSLAPRAEFKECDDCPEMVVVPAGSFMMGSPDSEEGRSTDEGPQHRVVFAHQFAVGKFPVTFGEWDACVSNGGCNGYPPSDRWGRGRHPVINVSWQDAKSYVAWLSRRTGKTYRLPTESEREYVTRAGTATVFWWGPSISSELVNYGGVNYALHTSSRPGGTVPVGSTLRPNPWGLFEVNGNVSDWMEDCYNLSYRGAPTDGSAQTSRDCLRRVTRGGNWASSARDLRAATRSHGPVGLSTDRVGVRVVRTLN